MLQKFLQKADDCSGDVYIVYPGGGTENIHKNPARQAELIDEWRANGKCLYLTLDISRRTAEQALKEAEKSNPGVWAEHSHYAAKACENIALCCKDLSADKDYIFGLLHDIGRYRKYVSMRQKRDRAV